MSIEKINLIIEAALFASDEPVTIEQILKLFVDEPEPPTKQAIKTALQQIEQDYSERVLHLKELASGYCFQVKQEFSPWVRKLWEERPPRYSRAFLETLVLIAYRQPITRAEIEAVRGVSVSSNIVRSLLEREWVRVVGHRDVPGKPALLATTRQFLDYFNLKNLNELPPLAELQDMNESMDSLEEKLNLEISGINVEEKISANDESITINNIEK